MLAVILQWLRILCARRREELIQSGLLGLFDLITATGAAAACSTADLYFLDQAVERADQARATSGEAYQVHSEHPQPIGMAD